MYQELGLFELILETAEFVEGLHRGHGVELDLFEVVEGGVWEVFGEEGELAVLGFGFGGCVADGMSVVNGERGEDFAGSVYDGGWDAGEFGDVDSVALAGAAGEDAMEEDDFFPPLSDGDVEVADAAGHALFEVGEFVVVRGEEGARAFVAEVFGDGPGEAEAVEGRGAAADFVEDDQGLGGGVVQDRGGLGHLDHEGGLAGVEGVIGADSGEDAVGDSDGRGLCGNE